MSVDGSGLKGVCVWLGYPGVIQLTLKAVDLFSESQGLGVRGRQAGRQRLNLTLEETQTQDGHGELLLWQNKAESDVQRFELHL